MAKFDPAFERTIGLEGSYSNDPNDPGKETKFGITKQSALDHGYHGEMKELPIELAKIIHKGGYWDNFGLDSINDQDVANEIFDTGVNCGTLTAGLIVQKALNLLNKNGSLWPDLKVDGMIGRVTIDAINDCDNKSNDYKTVFLKCLNALQVAYYETITEKNEKLERFFFGWVKNRA